MHDPTQENSPTRSTRSLKLACLFLIVLGAITTAIVLPKRIAIERHSNTVEMVVDYNELLALSTTKGMEIGDLLQQMKSAGATSVGLAEETLGTLEAQGELEINPRPTTTEAGMVAPDMVVQCSTLEVKEFVAGGLSNALPRVVQLSVGELGIGLRGDHAIYRDVGLGLRPSRVNAIYKAGLEVVPRLYCADWEDVPQMKAALKAAGPPLVRPHSTVIFIGKGLPGYPDAIEELATALGDAKLHYGSIEFGKQLGDAELGLALGGAFLRVHSYAPEDFSASTTAQAAARFALAVKDRNIRVLYIRFPQTSDVDPVVAAEAYIMRVAGAIRHSGFEPGAPQVFSRDFPIRRSELALLFLASGAAALLALLLILPGNLPAAGTIGLSVLFLLGGMAALGAALKTSGLGFAAFGLFAAMGYPFLALLWSYRMMDSWAAKRPTTPLLRTIGVFLIVTAFTLVGGLLVAAMMADTLYLMKVKVFLGPRYAIIIPVLIVTLLVIVDGVARSDEDLKAYWQRCWSRIVGFLTTPLSLLWIIVGGAAIALLTLVVLRAGNDSGIAVSSTEIHFRSAMEQVMMARPRTKEFLFGHPLLLLGFYLGGRGYRTAALVTLLAGAIGQTDVVNTFCHGHTPVLVSLARIANGAVLGLLIGLVLVAFAHFFLRRREQTQH